MAWVKRLDDYAPPTVRRGPVALALQALTSKACPVCGGATYRESSAWGASSISRRRCVTRHCGWAIKVEVTETRPDRTPNVETQPAVPVETRPKRRVDRTKPDPEDPEAA